MTPQMEVPNLAQIDSPESLANRPSTLGNGYWSIHEAALTVCLKLPQMQTEWSLFRTGSMGAAHFAYCTGSNTPSTTSQSNSWSTLALRAYGTGQALQNFGGTDASTGTVAL